MKLKGIIWEDLVNYKKISTTLMMPYCDFKCDKEAHCNVCQNNSLAKAPNYEYDPRMIINSYLNTPLSQAIVFQGLEPFDSWEDVKTIIQELRTFKNCNDDIVIYTGYNKEEIQDKIKYLKQYPNIIIKFGRFILGHPAHMDNVLGVKLASNNQYAEKIS